MLQSNSSNTTVALVGNPNSGKTTLFNRLTGLNQQIGNWPGVTVERQYGHYTDPKTKATITVVDLPGCYSLVATQDMALDEKITCEYILSSTNTTFINVIDAAHLSRDLYLSLQLLELGVPVIVALNCMDLAKDAGLKIDVQTLSKMLGCPVVPIIANTGENLLGLQQQIIIAAKNQYQADFPLLLSTTINFWRAHLTSGQAIHALEGDVLLANKLATVSIDAAQIAKKIATQIGEPLDLVIAKHRRGILNKILASTVTRQLRAPLNFSARIDSIVLHKIAGPLIFTAVMYLMFTVAINLGGMLQLMFDQLSEGLFVTAVNNALAHVGAAPWLIDLFANGIGKGINITITFIPVLATMFFCLGILESSGYMMRAAFIVDRVMRLFGLPGKSFVSMIVGFGCNVPAILGARTLSSKRERILTIMMTPFMSCSARLAIYAIFVAAFFPIGGQNIIFSLYVVGILVAVLTGLALRSTVLPSERSLSLMEMPDYRVPSLSTLMRQVWYRLKTFLLKAGGLIILLCVIINGLGNANLELIGKRITPAFAPIGISAENWPATVGLVTGLLAKEAVIGTLNSVYTGTADNNWSQAAESEMVRRFGGPVAAYAYLLFTLLYFPCVSVVATIAKELNKKWAAFSVVWSTGLAYIIAALYYQTATWSGVWSASSAWIVGLVGVLAVLFVAARWMVGRELRYAPGYKVVPTPVNLII